MTTARDDCEELLGSVMPFATELLEKYREFFPFGATMSPQGVISHDGAWTGEEQPPSSEVIELLTRAFHQQAANGELKATAIVYDIRTIPPGKQEKQDAICVALDHRDDLSIHVIFPYSFSTEGELVVEDPVATSGEGEIFRSA
jgi:hypothetical protein